MIKKRRVAIDEFHNYKMFGVSRLNPSQELDMFLEEVSSCKECSLDEKTFCPDHSCDWLQWAKHDWEFIKLTENDKREDK